MHGTWRSGGVEFELQAHGDPVLLTVIHRRLPDHATQLNVATGRHTHLDLLADHVSGARPGAFWEAFARIKKEYAQRLSE